MAEEDVAATQRSLEDEYEETLDDIAFHLEQKELAVEARRKSESAEKASREMPPPPSREPVSASPARRDVPDVQTPATGGGGWGGGGEGGWGSSPKDAAGGGGWGSTPADGKGWGWGGASQDNDDAGGWGGTQDDGGGAWGGGGGGRRRLGGALKRMATAALGAEAGGGRLGCLTGRRQRRWMGLGIRGERRGRERMGPARSSRFGPAPRRTRGSRSRRPESEDLKIIKRRPRAPSPSQEEDEPAPRPKATTKANRTLPSKKKTTARGDAHGLAVKSRRTRNAFIDDEAEGDGETDEDAEADSEDDGFIDDGSPPEEPLDPTGWSKRWRGYRQRRRRRRRGASRRGDARGDPGGSREVRSKEADRGGSGYPRGHRRDARGSVPVRGIVDRGRRGRRRGRRGHAPWTVEAGERAAGRVGEATTAGGRIRVAFSCRIYKRERRRCLRGHSRGLRPSPASGSPR